MDDVFKALADPTRRGLLDELFKDDGQSLSALEKRLPMTRFGVMKHLKLLEQAGLGCPERLVESCRKQVEEFRAGGVRADDETLLAVQYVGAGARAAVV